MTPASARRKCASPICTAPLRNKHRRIRTRTRFSSIRSVSDPAGHSFGRAPEPVEPLPPDKWQHNRTYLFAIDLFNAGYFWEAHEQWEALWHAAGRKGATADFLKALIHLAAAGVKHLE